MARPIRWGIIGLGRIAARFAGSLMAAPDARIAAVLSREQAKADAFAAACGASAFIDAAAFLKAELDIIYIASPHTLHREQAIACLEAGKAVLIEKPMAASAADARAIAMAAGKAGRFAMEAMWTRFLPAAREAKRLAEQGELGVLKGFQASLSFPNMERAGSRLFDPALGGGALLDLGVYPVSLAIHLLGAPKAVQGMVIRASTGVDRQASLILDHGGALSTLSCGLDAEGANDAVLIGSKARLRLQSPLYAPAAVILTPSANPDGEKPVAVARTGSGRLGAIKQILRPMRRSRLIAKPFAGDGFAHQIAEVHARLREGALESPVMPLADSIAVLEVIDAVRGLPAV